jgi:hypothetical protein
MTPQHGSRHLLAPDWPRRPRPYARPHTSSISWSIRRHQHPQGRKWHKANTRRQSLQDGRAEIQPQPTASGRRWAPHSCDTSSHRGSEWQSRAGEAAPRTRSGTLLVWEWVTQEQAPRRGHTHAAQTTSGDVVTGTRATNERAHRKPGSQGSPEGQHSLAIPPGSDCHTMVAPGGTS